VGELWYNEVSPVYPQVTTHPDMKCRYEEAKQLVRAKLLPQLEQSCIIAKYKAQTERMDGFPLQVRAVCCQLGKGTQHLTVPARLHAAASTSC
jgi:hypothetical protein